jgi:WD40 repeat protein
VAFSPDGKFVASAAADKYVKKFDAATGEQAAQFEGHTNHVLGVAWRAGGSILATCGAEGAIRLWDANTGDRIRDIEGFAKPVNAVRFVGQTQFLVTSSGDPLVRMVNTDNGGVQVNYGGPAEYMYSIDATADPNNGVVVAGGHDGVLRIWLANGQVLQTLAPPE